MKLQLDQFVECLEQITQQLETLEMTLAFSSKLHQEKLTGWRQPIGSDTGSDRGSISQSFDTSLLIDFSRSCKECSS
jgi:hypothetical protein